MSYNPADKFCQPVDAIKISRRGPITDVTTLMLEHFRQQFARDGNPLHVWSAYQLARRRRVPCLREDGELDTMTCEPLPLPEWVADYLDRCAEALLAGTPPGPALGLAIKGGGHSKFKQLADRSRDGGIYSYIEFLMGLEREEVRPDHPILASWQRGEQGAAKLDLICEYIAEQTQHQGNAFSSKPLSSKTIRDLYFRLKPK